MTGTMFSIKPHHFVDILCALGDGTDQFVPHPYGHAVHSVARQLLDHPHIRVKIELHADSICAPCCHNIDGICDDTIDTSYRPNAPASKRAWNLLIDQRWCTRLPVQQAEMITPAELCRRISAAIDTLPEIYHEITEPERIRQRRVRLTRGVARFRAISDGV